jgi:hypothetical protein
MKIQQFALALLVGIFCLSSTHPTQAQESAMGEIASMLGTVEIQRAKQTTWIKARKYTEIFFGDTIQTSEESEAVISLVDDSIMRIRANSKVVLNTRISPVERKSSVLLFFGRLWNKVSRKALRKKVFEVQTPTAVCGVRGTDFETAAYEDGTMLVQVVSGEVEVDNEATQETLAASQGTQVSFEQKEIRVTSDFDPDWEKDQQRSRENLLGDGEKYGGYVRDEIYRRRDHLKNLVDRAADLVATKEQLKQQAAAAQDAGDTQAYETYLIEIEKISEKQKALNKKIAYYSRRLECHFGLFSHYGDLAKHPEISKRFKGREFILNQLDNIESIYAEFDAMAEEGMKISMEDMEDFMDEMREKMTDFKRTRSKKGDIFNEMD